MFPYEKYKYFTNNKDLVVAEQTYAGKKYRGKAVLGKGDTFDLEIGKQLAAARCDFTICSKRFRASNDKATRLEKLIEMLSVDLREAEEYRADALREFACAAERLCELEEKLGIIVPNCAE